MPHERSLVKRLEGKPFALIGISLDETRDKCLNVIEREKLTWRNVWDQGRATGPIAKKYNIRGLPTIFILDVDGVIRYRFGDGGDMDRLVGTLLKELEAARKKAG